MPNLTINVKDSNDTALDYIEGKLLGTNGYPLYTLSFSSGTATVAVDSASYYIVLSKAFYNIQNPYLVNATNDASYTITIDPLYSMPAPQSSYCYIYSFTDSNVILHYTILGDINFPEPDLLLKADGFISPDSGLLGFFAPRNNWVRVNIGPDAKQFLAPDADYLSLQKMINPRQIEYTIEGPDACSLNETCVYKTYLYFEDMNKQEVLSSWQVPAPSQIVGQGQILFAQTGTITITAQTVMNGVGYSQTKDVTVS